jgi:hypothetical protein
MPKLRKKRKGAKRRAHLRGYARNLHGAFSSEGAAIRKAKSVGGYIIKRAMKAKGGYYRPRWVVITQE